MIGVVGASGFVGNAIADHIQQQGAVARFCRNPRKNSDDIKYDLTNKSVGKDIFKGCSVLIHAAGIVGANANLSEEDYVRVNVEGTHRLFTLARNSGVSRVILLSTGAVYAPSDAAFTESSQTGPTTAYGRSKLAAEELTKQFSRDLEFVVLRLFFPFGSHQRPERLIPRLVEKVLAKQPIELSDGIGPRLSICHISDIVRCVQCVLDNWRSATVNVAYVEPVSLREVVCVVGDCLEIEPTFVSVDRRSESIIANTDLCKCLFGFNARISLTEGLSYLKEKKSFPG